MHQTSPILILLILVLGLWFVVWFYIVLPYRMAEKRNREGIAWVLISFIGSPILAILALLILGKRRE